MKIRMLIVDDHPLFREGLVHHIESNLDAEVVAQASDGFEAIAKCRELEPDMVILDVSMPKMRGTEAIIKIKEICPDVKVLILSQYDQADYVKHALKNGATGYLLKKSAADELAMAIKMAHNDQIYLSPELTKNVLLDWASSQKKNANKNDTLLTLRENEVVKLIAEGYTNKQVASFLHISPKTVETHRLRIMKKLELGSFAELIRYAIKSNLIE